MNLNNLNAAVNMEVQIFQDPDFISSGNVPRRGIARSYGSFIFYFLGNLHTVFPLAVPIYIPTQSAQGVPFLYNPINTCYSLSF